MTIYIICLVAFFTHIGFAGSRLTVPLFAVDQGASPLLVGTIVAVYGFFPALLALAAGRITDRLGFRIPMIFGTAGVFGGLLLPAMFPALPTLYVTATMLGVSFMVLQLATQTLAGAIAQPADRARNFSYLSIGFGMANLTGPMLSGFLIDRVGYTWTFCAISLPVLGAVTITALGKRWVPNVHKKSDATKGSAFDLLKIRPLRNTLIASGLVSSAWDVYQFFMPIYGRSQGLSATAIGLILSCFAIAIILVRVVLPYFVRRTGEAPMLTYAMFIACTAFALFPIFKDPIILGAISFLLGMGCGVGQPLSMSLVYAASPKGRAGEATGMRLTVNQATHVVVPLIFGAVGSALGYVAVFGANAAFLVAGGYLSWRNHSRPANPDPDRKTEKTE